MTTIILPSSQLALPAIEDHFAGADASVVAAKNWTVLVSGAGAADINAQRARFVTAAAGSFGDYVALRALMASVADVEVVGKHEFGVMSAEKYTYVAVRCDAPNFFTSPHTGYGMRIANTVGGVATIAIEKTVAGTGSFLFTGSNFSPTAGDTYLFRVRIQGSAISIKYWASGLPEPTAWLASVTDTAISGAGFTQLIARGGNAASATTHYLHRALVTPL